MLESASSNKNTPTVFCLHYLGGSAREWTAVRERLAAKVDIVPIDLPGFGSASEVDGYAVADMTEFVARAVRKRAPSSWMLVGHSMGAKVAAALARAIEDGRERLPGLIGLVLVAGSPPSPEPMDEAQRRKMLAYFSGDAVANRRDAQEYAAANSETLDPRDAEIAVDDALRANRAAWIAWLESGSREDWDRRVGILQTPTLVVAGADDENLGPDAQHRLTVPHFANVRAVTIPGVKHLIPMEATEQLARLIEEHAVEGVYRKLIASHRVSTKTRDALEQRGKPDEPGYVSKTLDRHALQTLRAVLSRVIPQEDATPIDLAARIDKNLDSREGDGWRFAMLPADAVAYEAGLRTLDAIAQVRYRERFIALASDAQDRILRDAAAGELHVPSTAGQLDGMQMRAWFEEVRADAVKVFMLHPKTLARLGYSGIANGGDGQPKSGFARVGVGEREAWEPLAMESGS